MNDRPNADELIEAVRQFLERELVPALTDARLRYQALIAAHVLGVARRELAQPDRDDELATLLGESGGVVELNARLCERIEAGAFDADEARLIDVLRRQVARKLAVARP